MNTRPRKCTLLLLLTTLAYFALLSTRVTGTCTACTTSLNQKAVKITESDLSEEELAEECTNTEDDLEMIKRFIDRYNGDRSPHTHNHTLNLDLFEGDIANVNISNLRDLAVLDKTSKWPKGRVPYQISPVFTPQSRSIINQVFSTYRQKTCINFVRRTNEKDYIDIRMTPGGCYSSVGRQGGGQVVSLGLGCVHVGIIQHELMHAIGFWHEQSRPDRDKYIIINWINIQPGMAVNFFKIPRKEVTMLKLPYDISSIMHYGPFDFARDPFYPTIIPRRFLDFIYMGQRSGFSRLDLKKINKYYNCTK